MSVPTCRVRATLFDSVGGPPVAGATILATLSAFEVSEDGYVAPHQVQAVTNADGEAFLDLFPNELGSVRTVYEVRIVSPLGKSLRVQAVVPNDATADLHEIATLPPYDGQQDGALVLSQVLAARTQVFAARDTTIQKAAEASTSAGAAAGSATAAAASQGAAAGSQAAAAGSATAAAGSAAAAATSQGAAAGSATAAAGSATAAAGSATAASGSAGAAAGSASSAATSNTQAQAARDTAISILPQMGATKPSNPIPGQRWKDPEDGRSYEWTVTASSSSWVEYGAVVQVGVATAVGATGAAQRAEDAEDVATAKAQVSTDKAAEASGYAAQAGTLGGLTTDADLASNPMWSVVRRLVNNVPGAVDPLVAVTQALMNRSEALRYATGVTMVGFASPQAAVDYCIANGRTLRIKDGATDISATLDLNGSSHAAPGGSQLSGLVSLKGTGRFVASTLRAVAPMASDVYVAVANNLSGIHHRDFGINGNGVARRGLDISWKGDGSPGQPGVAPSNLNVVENVWVENCPDVGINADQLHDTKFTGIVVRGIGPSGVALSMQGSGGALTMYSVWLVDGLLRFGCQNGGVTDSGFFAGVELTGGGFNHVSWSVCHFYKNPTTGVIINSLAVGNGSRGQNFKTCWFNTTDYVLSGRWHDGATFDSCHFKGWTAFANSANFVPAAGTGSLPVFEFRHCTFEVNVPTSVPGKYLVRIHDCTYPDGVRRSDEGDIVTSGTIVSTASAQEFGFAKVRSAQNTALAAGEALTIPMATGTWLLTVISTQPSANNRRSATYQVAGFNGDGEGGVIGVTQLAANNGSAGPTTPFTVSYAAGSIVVTNTSSSTVSMTAAMFGVGT